MGTLYDKLSEYGDSDYYAFHMPGHKRNKDIIETDLPYGIDITEITGFDDLHHAEGILKEAQERAARAYHAEETHYLVNGSTVGILSAILGSTKKGNRILMARNCHKSVYHAVFLNELRAEYIYPEYDAKLALNGAIEPERVRQALEKDAAHKHADRIKAVVMVSPTYDGVLSDVKAIADIVHEYGIPLIVDEAHGAHFGFHPYFPENANAKGADIVIHSLHKTLPALTQTALIHLNGHIADRESIRMYLHMLQTSSPSYVLMSSMDECISMLLEKGSTAFDLYVERLESARRKLSNLRRLHLVETGQYDRSKLVISVKGTGITGKQLHRVLTEQYHLELEMSSVNYVLAMTSIGDTDEGIQRLVKALFKVDIEIDTEMGAKMDEQSFQLPVMEQVCIGAACRNGEISARPYEECIGYVSAEYAYVYPPGIPVVVPGERLSESAVQLLERYEAAGFEIHGLKHSGEIEVMEI